MHEVGIMQNALEIALDRAGREGATRIRQIKMRVGALSGVVPEALEFAFEVVARGTMAEGARLDIDQIPVLCFCPACSLEFQPVDLCCECPRCSQPSAEIRGGRELELASLEVT